MRRDETEQLVVRRIGGILHDGSHERGELSHVDCDARFCLFVRTRRDGSELTKSMLSLARKRLNVDFKPFCTDAD